MVNDKKGDILGLKDDLKNIVFDKIDEVASKSAGLNIPFDLNGDLQNEIYKSKNVVESGVTYVVGKHIYPKTETYIANTSG